LLLVSENLVDDDFARHALGSIPELPAPDSLQVIPLAINRRSFTHLLLVPPTYHQYFKGILDAKRTGLVQCLPIYRCEFSGTETVDEFTQMRRHAIDTINWSREITPKVVMRFENPRTSAGTGDHGVISTWKVLLREIDNLSGVNGGFIECRNWMNRTMKIMSPNARSYALMREGSIAELCDGTSVAAKAWEFLVS
jgi:hypothetical protein